MANATTAADAKKRQVAEHFYLDSDGNVVEDIMAAKGIRYVHLASKDTFDYYVKPGTSGMVALALFGARTLATNEASQVRQKEGSGGDQVGGIRERFSLIDTGQWVDR